MNYELENYVLSHIDPEGDYLYRLWRATNVHLLRGRMASGHLQGRISLRWERSADTALYAWPKDWKKAEWCIHTR